MNTKAALQKEKNRLIVSGDLNFSNVMQIWRESLWMLKTAEHSMTIDFSEVKSSNSAGLALIVELLKWARQHHNNIVLIAIPKEIISIAKVSGLEHVVKLA